MVKIKMLSDKAKQIKNHDNVISLLIALSYKLGGGERKSIMLTFQK